MSTDLLLRSAIFLAVVICIDLYAYKGISTALAHHSPVIRRLVQLTYWSISIGLLLTLLWAILNLRSAADRSDHGYLFTLVGIFLLFFLPKVVMVLFHLADDLVNLVRMAWLKWGATPSAGDGETMDRTRFLSQMGLIAASIPFVGVLYGITKGRRDLQVEQVRVGSRRMPKALAGLRIVQISDLHLGSYGGDETIMRQGVERINAERPDLIVFTGDMVNDLAVEAERFIPILAELKAPMGKFSVLGNHDYSDYVNWDSPEAKAANLERMKATHAAMGFRLLLDEHEELEYGGVRFGMLGVQNWGVRFQQYGDLARTLRGTEHLPYRILLSHDPSHWDAQVRGTGVDLMLSGHTHGAQLGVKLGGRRFSPAQWVYKQWAGLYSMDDQQLYVNRGFGYIGFPGRVGMPPEITVLELA